MYDFPYLCYLQKYFTKIYRVLYGEAMLERHQDGGLKVMETLVNKFCY